MVKTSVREAFDRCAREYDRDRRKFIPCFDDFYGSVITLLEAEGAPPRRLLDLGAGTGLLSAFVLDRFPGAHVDLVDLSDEMLAQARARFRGREGQVSFRQADYAAEPLAEAVEEPYDAVVSALSIHHLSGEEKASLFGRMYDCLAPGGLFINADQVMGETDAVERLYRKVWFAAMDGAGLAPDVLDAARERMKEDKMSTLGDQLRWMRDAGFRGVNCWYQQFSFAVYGGRKPA